MRLDIPAAFLSPSVPGLGLGGGLRGRRRREGLLGFRRFQGLDSLRGLRVELPHLKEGRKGDQRGESLTLPPLNLLKFCRQTLRWVVPVGLPPSRRGASFCRCRQLAWPPRNPAPTVPSCEL